MLSVSVTAKAPVAWRLDPRRAGRADNWTKVQDAPCTRRSQRLPDLHADAVGTARHNSASSLRRHSMRAPSVLVLAALLLTAPAMAADDVQVMIVGGFHMSGGHDMHNVQVDDVLAPKRQAEIQAVVDSVAKFRHHDGRRRMGRALHVAEICRLSRRQAAVLAQRSDPAELPSRQTDEHSGPWDRCRRRFSL